MSKSDRRARKKARRMTDVILVRCDSCGLVQPLIASGRPTPKGCTRCGHIYGTYAEIG